jgi:hypothetical protein
MAQVVEHLPSKHEALYCKKKKMIIDLEASLGNLVRPSLKKR